jgi:two-component system response regulator NreC
MLGLAMAIRVFLADDHAILREGVAALLDAEPDIEVVGQASTAKAAVEGCLSRQADVALIDLSMPGSGLTAITELHRARPELRCIALTMHDDPSYLQAVLDGGGAGFLVKGAEADELSAAVRQVAAGGAYVKLSLDAHGRPSPRVSPAQLSRRERQVLVLLARGFGNREIGEQLQIGRKTVDTYRARVQAKLGLEGRPEIVEYALDMGLLARRTNSL